MLWQRIAIAVLGLLVGIVGGEYGLKPDIAALQAQTTRIEHYLSTKDPEYWKVVRTLDP